MDLEDEVRSLTEKSKTIKDKYQDELEQAQSDLHTKISECNTMQGQVGGHSQSGQDDQGQIPR